MASIAPVRLNHAVLFVADLDRSVRFYTEVFGMEVVSTEPRANAAFLRLPRGDNHHDLGLFGVGSAGGPRRRGAVGLYHLAWQVHTIDELVALRARLVEVGSLVGESDHGVSKSLYAEDPNGIEFEVMWAVPKADWPSELFTQRLDLVGAVSRWSGVDTAEQ